MAQPNADCWQFFCKRDFNVDEALSSYSFKQTWFLLSSGPHVGDVFEVMDSHMLWAPARVIVKLDVSRFIVNFEGWK